MHLFLKIYDNKKKRNFLISKLILLWKTNPFDNYIVQNFPANLGFLEHSNFLLDIFLNKRDIYNLSI